MKQKSPMESLFYSKENYIFQNKVVMDDTFGICKVEIDNDKISLLKTDDFSDKAIPHSIQSNIDLLIDC